jgi:hypothetical protein
MLTVLTILAASLWRILLLQLGCWGRIRDRDRDRARDRGRLDIGGRGGGFKALVHQHLGWGQFVLCPHNLTNFH